MKHPHEKPHHPHWPLACLLFASVLALGLLSVHESSTWRHIAAGARILADGALPRVDAFSYTVSGRPWSTDSWLSDVLFKFLHDNGGPSGLGVFKACVLALAFTLLLPVNPSSPLLAASVLLAAAAASWRGFTETPAVFDFLLLSLLLRALRLRRPFTWPMALKVFLIQLLWANLNGSTAVLGLWVVGLKVFKTGLREGPREWLRHGALAAAALGGLLLNPLGLQVVPRLLTLAEAGLPTPAASLWGVFALGGAAACWVTLQQEFVLTMTTAAILLLSVALPALRPLAALAAAPVVTLALGHWLQPMRDAPWRVVRWGALAALLVAAHWRLVHKPLAAAAGYGSGHLQGALHYLVANGVTGRGFNEPETGDALLAVGRPVFCDTRAGLYDRGFLRDARRWSKRWRRLDEIYSFDYALLLNKRAGYPARLLDEDPRWALAYADDDALIYVKRSGLSGWLAGKTALKPNSLWPQAGPRNLDELDRWQVQAPDAVQPLLWKAAVLDGLKAQQKGQRLLDVARARPRMEWDAELNAALGWTLERRGDAAGARAAYQKAVLLAARAGNAEAEAEIIPRLLPLLGNRRQERMLRDRVRSLAPQAAD